MTLQDVEKQITEFDWPSDERIDAIGQNGSDSQFYEQRDYNKVVETGVYEA
jgi:hypothetical protein